MTAPVDCDPAWPDTHPADDQPPSPAICRQAEIADSSGQGCGPVALRTAHNIPAGSYL